MFHIFAVISSEPLARRALGSVEEDDEEEEDDDDEEEEEDDDDDDDDGAPQARQQTGRSCSLKSWRGLSDDIPHTLTVQSSEQEAR